MLRHAIFAGAYLGGDAGGLAKVVDHLSSPQSLEVNVEAADSPLQVKVDAVVLGVLDPAAVEKALADAARVVAVTCSGDTAKRGCIDLHFIAEQSVDVCVTVVESRVRTLTCAGCACKPPTKTLLLLPRTFPPVLHPCVSLPSLHLCTCPLPSHLPCTFPLPMHLPTCHAKDLAPSGTRRWMYPHAPRHTRLPAPHLPACHAPFYPPAMQKTLAPSGTRWRTRHWMYSHAPALAP